MPEKKDMITSLEDVKESLNQGLSEKKEGFEVVLNSTRYLGYLGARTLAELRDFEREGEEDFKMWEKSNHLQKIANQEFDGVDFRIIRKVMEVFESAVLSQSLIAHIREKKIHLPQDVIEEVSKEYKGMDAAEALGNNFRREYLEALSEVSDLLVNHEAIKSEEAKNLCIDSMRKVYRLAIFIDKYFHDDEQERALEVITNTEHYITFIIHSSRYMRNQLLAEAGIDDIFSA